MVIIEIKRLSSEGILPQKAHTTDAGYDLYASKPLALAPGEWAAVETGIALAMPVGIEAQIRPRSGLALKHGITLLNAPGTIDADYRGEIKVIMINHGRNIFEILPGMKIAQMVFSPILETNLLEVEQLDETERGQGGFGSTGY